MDKVTIVIPTRDRADVLRYCLQAALSLTYPNLAILVSDNSSVDDTAEVVSGFRDERLTYVRTAKRVSMSSNWEFALSHVQEGWVTVIGDDDAVLPGGIERMLEIAAETGVSAIRSATCGYSWPSILKQPFGRLSIPLRRGYQVRNTQNELQSVLDGRMTYNKLPVLYNGGFVRTEVIDAIRNITGRVFCSQVPDVYSAIAICSQIDRYVYSFEPLAINGASAHSGGSATFSARKGKIWEGANPAEKYMSEVDFPFHPSVPLTTAGRQFPAIQATIYECFLQAKAVLPLPRLKVDAKTQLDLILAEAEGRARIEDFYEWAAMFRLANGLDTLEPLRVPFWSKLKMLSRRWQQILDAIDSVSLRGSNVEPLSDVHNVAEVAASHLRLTPFRPSHWGARVIQIASRRMLKII